MSRYTATITHHSIATAPRIPVGDTIRAAKINATRKFGADFLDYLITIYDTSTDDDPRFQHSVAQRRVDDKRWTNVADVLAA